MPSYVAGSGPLKIFTTNDFRKDTDALLRKGCIPIGNSSFNAASNRVSESDLRDQAEKVGAQVVLSKLDRESEFYPHRLTTQRASDSGLILAYW
jgi:hypothetical protein